MKINPTVGGILGGAALAVTIWGTCQAVGRAGASPVNGPECFEDGTCYVPATGEKCEMWNVYPEGSVCDSVSYGHGSNQNGRYVTCPDGNQRPWEPGLQSDPCDPRSWSTITIHAGGGNR